MLLFIQNLPSPHYYRPTIACLPPLTLEPHSGLQKHVLSKLKPFSSQAKATVVFQEGKKKYYKDTVTQLWLQQSHAERLNRFLNFPQQI